MPSHLLAPRTTIELKEVGGLGSVDSKYVVIMPSRDEARFIAGALQSLVNQTIPPILCVVVDDGSTDQTADIAEEFSRRHAWIRVVRRPDRGGRAVGGGVVEAFYAGYGRLEIDDYQFICKMDADVTLGPRYFETAMRRMAEDERLGGVSGKVFNPVGNGEKEERIIDEMVSGALNFWRRACWEQVGGYVREVMWDGIIVHRARMFGWKTRSYRDEDLRIVHHRLMGSSHKSVLHGRLRWGRGQWFMGTHPVYILASGVFRFRERPYVIGGLLIIAGYYAAALTGAKRYDDLAFRSHLRSWQLKRLGLGFLAPTPPEATSV